MTGGYTEGAMGMATLAAHGIAKKHSKPMPVGVTFPQWWPNDSQETPGENIAADSLSERQKIFFEKATAFVVLGIGGLGSINELTGILKEEELRIQASTTGKGEFRSRPIIIVDPSGETTDILKLIFQKYGKKHLNTQSHDLIDQIFILGQEQFESLEKYPLLLKLSAVGKELVVQILDSKKDHDFPVINGVNTLRDKLIK